jgi:hypothetical protein
VKARETDIKRIGRRRLRRSGRNDRPRGRTMYRTKGRRETKDGGGMMKRGEEETEGAEDGKIGRKRRRKKGRKEWMRG